MVTRPFFKNYRPFQTYQRCPPCYASVSSLAPRHHDVPSYLAYADTISLSPKSPTYIGTRYEYLCVSTLARLSFSLTRMGGSNDAGVDLFGTWKLPSLPHPLRVLVQCKARRANISPETVRELEGAAAGAPEGWRGDGTIRVLCAKRPATKGVREAVKRSATPLVWVMIEDTDQDEGKVRQVLWNQRVGELGAQGMAVGLQHSSRGHGTIANEAVLLWKGKPWNPDVGNNG